MTDDQRMALINQMGVDVSSVNTAIAKGDKSAAQAAFVSLMAAAGYLAMEIDGLDNTHRDSAGRPH